MLGAQALRTKQKAEQKEKERKKREKLRFAEIVKDPYSKRNSIDMHNQLLEQLNERKSRRCSHGDDHNISMIVKQDERKNSLVITTIPEYIPHEITGSNVQVRRMSMVPQATNSVNGTPHKYALGKIGRANSMAYPRVYSDTIPPKPANSYETGIEKTHIECVKCHQSSPRPKSPIDLCRRNSSRASLVGKRIMKFFGISDKEKENH